jgi:hypothetical protein
MKRTKGTKANPTSGTSILARAGFSFVVFVSLW